MHHLIIPPDADTHDILGGIWDEVDIDVFSKGHMGNFNSMFEQRNAAIAIDHSLFP